MAIFILVRPGHTGKVPLVASEAINFNEDNVIDAEISLWLEPFLNAEIPSSNDTRTRSSGVGHVANVFLNTCQRPENFREVEARPWISLSANGLA